MTPRKEEVGVGWSEYILRTLECVGVVRPELDVSPDTTTRVTGAGVPENFRPRSLWSRFKLGRL